MKVTNAETLQITHDNNGAATMAAYSMCTHELCQLMSTRAQPHVTIDS